MSPFLLIGLPPFKDQKENGWLPAIPVAGIHWDLKVCERQTALRDRCFQDGSVEHIRLRYIRYFRYPIRVDMSHFGSRKQEAQAKCKLSRSKIPLCIPSKSSVIMGRLRESKTLHGAIAFLGTHAA